MSEVRRPRAGSHDVRIDAGVTANGFTLVEVMIALLIFSMIAAAGVGILSFSVRAGAAATQRLDDAAALDRTLSLLSADLAQAVERSTRDERGNVLPAFVGGGGAMTLVRGGWANLDGAARPGLQKVEYALVDGTFERTGWPMLDGAAPMAPAALLTNIAEARVRFRYQGAWSDRWDGANGVALPDAAEWVLVKKDGSTYRAVMLVGTGYHPLKASAGAT